MIVRIGLNKNDSLSLQQFLSKIQQRHSSVYWSAEELIKALAASGRAVDLKEKLLA
ncbi:hypothetical protein ACJ7K1_02785 [Paenibacillus elgii]